VADAQRQLTSSPSQRPRQHQPHSSTYSAAASTCLSALPMPDVVRESFVDVLPPRTAASPPHRHALLVTLHSTTCGSIVVRALDLQLSGRQFNYYRPPQLVVGWVTVFGRANHLRPTQPPALNGTGNEYRPKCGDVLRSKGRYMAHSTCGQTSGWQVNLCDSSLTRAIPEHLRDEHIIIKRCIRLPFTF